MNTKVKAAHEVKYTADHRVVTTRMPSHWKGPKEAMRLRHPRRSIA